MRRPQRPDGYYCAICPFSSGGKIIQKKTNAYNDPCPQPMAWARVIKDTNQFSPLLFTLNFFHLAIYGLAGASTFV